MKGSTNAAQCGRCAMIWVVFCRRTKDRDLWAICKSGLNWGVSGQIFNSFPQTLNVEVTFHSPTRRWYGGDGSDGDNYFLTILQKRQVVQNVNCHFQNAKSTKWLYKSKNCRRRMSWMKMNGILQTYFQMKNEWVMDQWSVLINPGFLLFPSEGIIPSLLCFNLFSSFTLS